MDDWGIDVVMTASQKGLGTPPGLSIVVASTRSMKVSLYPSYSVEFLNCHDAGL